MSDDASAPARLIGVDWGTSSLRAHLIGAHGTAIETRETAEGLQALPEGGFPATLASALRGWPADLPVLMSGMVGSRSGWREAPYLDVAGGIDAAALAAGLIAVEDAGRPAFVVPGVRSAPGAAPDVMRGEETAILGLGDAAEGTAVLPGTHSKWAEVRDGRLTGFRTVMTGEIYALLSRHSILARTIASDPDEEAEARGLKAGLDAVRAMERPGDLLGRLFAVRAGPLLGTMAEAEAGGFLSGLLIGAEIAAEAGGVTGPVAVVASEGLAERYERALAAFGLSTRPVPDRPAARGLHAIARAARLIEGDDP